MLELLRMNYRSVNTSRNFHLRKYINELNLQQHFAIYIADFSLIFLILHGMDTVKIS